MSSGSKIEWTEATWNPVTGCSKISAGCLNCYAERLARRLQAMGQPNYANGFEVTTHPHMLNRPLTWRRPQMIFVNSMSDLFHEKVPDEYIESVFDVMRQASWHTFQVLTKRAERLAEFCARIELPPNVWVGVSIESGEYAWRADLLRQVPAVVRFLSLEPMIGAVPDLVLDGIDWVIVGGESGPGARPLRESWVRDVRDRCLDAGVPLFFKQWGGVNKKKAGRLLEGREWRQMPSPTSHSRATG